MEDMPEPFAEADQERAVKAEALADALNVRRRRLVAGDHCGGVARRDVEEAENEQGNQRHHRHGRRDTPNDVAEHRSLYSSAAPRAPTHAALPTEEARSRLTFIPAS